MIFASAALQNGASMDPNVLCGPQRPVAALLLDCYALLAGAVADSDAGPDYRDELHRLIAAAQQAEPPGASPSALPLLACAAAGGDPGRAVPIGAAWRGLQLAVRLPGSIERSAADSAGARPPTPAQLCQLALGLTGAAWRSLERLPVRQQRAQQPDFLRALLQMSGAHHNADAPGGPADLDSYRRLLGIRGGACFALAARAGARCANSSRDMLGLYTQFGHNVGIMLAIADDLSDFRTAVGTGVWTRGKHTLPIVYALQVATAAERSRLEALLARAATDREAEAQARHLIVMSGAEVYVRAELTRHRSLACSMLTESPLTSEPFLHILHGWTESLQLLPL